jgi:two-component system CheB/CheR fusion protein
MAFTPKYRVMSESEPLSNLDAGLEHLIEKISTEHGFDVRGYKRSTLYRRIRKRMADVGCTEIGDYAVRLETDRHEYPQLINTILINVTEFFRDPEAWEYLKQECLAPLIRRKPPGESIRAWCVGCATGEEPYSLAMSLAELLGDRGLRDVKIYATDVDDGALAVARSAVYNPDNARNVGSPRLERFFDEFPAGRYGIRRELRSSVIFGRHNALADPPISRLDLLICRNLLIYFDTETQQQILTRFHYGLRDDGCLFLGKAETLMTRSLLFRPLEPRFRIFQRVPQPGAVETMLSTIDPRRTPREQRDAGAAARQNYTIHAIVDQAQDPVLLLDSGGRILMASEAARELFRAGEDLVGKSLLELDEKFRPVPLRLALEDVRATNRSVRVEELALPQADGSPLTLSLEVRPILDPQGSLIRILVWGRDTTPQHKLTEELTQARQELETISEELQTTNEELETTNEELQSTNEELETTNEELQSTNEELETTIEELQSTNEELETANDELRSRENDLNSLTGYQESVLSSLQLGIIVLNRSFVVTSWNAMCHDTWGLREDEAVGQELFALDIGLPVEQLREPVQNVVGSRSREETLAVPATNRRGKTIQVQIRVHPLSNREGETTGAVIVMEDVTERQGA